MSDYMLGLTFYYATAIRTTRRTKPTPARIAQIGRWVREHAKPGVTLVVQ